MKNARKIKILHIITNLPVGGAQDNTLLTVERLDRTKYDVALLCAPTGNWVKRAEALADTELIFIDRLVRPIRLFNDLQALRQIYKILKNYKFDIVHTHSSKPGVLGRLAAKMAGVPVIIHTIHGFPFHDFMNPIVCRFFISLERFMARISNKLLTVSRLNLEKAVKLKLAPRAKFVNVYSGIDFDKFDVCVDTKKLKQEYGFGNGVNIVGMVGRLSRQKAPLDFVRAIPGILQAHQDVLFVLVGDGELREKTEALAKKLGVENNVRILGFRNDIPELLHLIDVYVLTSHWEGLGRSLTEAMYTGRPVVATRVEGVPELVEDGKTGLLVEPCDIDGIARSVIKLLEDRKTAARLGSAAARKISDRFRVDVMVRNLEQLYESQIMIRTSRKSPIPQKQ